MSIEGERRIARARAQYDKWYDTLILVIREETADGTSETAAARGSEVEENFAIMLAGLIGLQRHTGRQAFR